MKRAGNRPLYTIEPETRGSMENNTVKYQISEARKRLPEIYDQVVTGRVVTLTRRDKTRILVVPEKYEALSSRKRDYVKCLSLMIAEKLLPNAEPDFLDPQVAEFERLSLDQLKALLDVSSLPMDTDLRSRLIAVVGEECITRLEKRYKISSQIHEAQIEGLYEASEHMTGLIEP